ncbi:unnamed protein product [Paramecium sonneborni]|uniref:Uncharacterized protein n=1 Tax=Paramecium sonneborni TaxID=65129 RepID=A0A8S1ND61_9CILI|nr:unnamed protein product [Paramecium sonneborni]
MQETQTQQSRGFRAIIAKKKDRQIHNNQPFTQNGFFLIEGIKMLNQCSKLEQQKESETKRLTRKQFQNLFKQSRLSIMIDKEKTINNSTYTKRNYAPQKPSVLNFEFSLDQNAFRNKSIDISKNRRLQWNKKTRKDVDLTQRERFYTVQFITKSEGKYETRNLLEMNIQKYQKLVNSPPLSRQCKQKYQL